MEKEIIGEGLEVKILGRCPHCNNYLYARSINGSYLRAIKCGVCGQIYLVSGSEKSGMNILRL
jgi:DNA-directed RNA polymerase subunit M/transcription elongation factor TFIIS